MRPRRYFYSLRDCQAAGPPRATARCDAIQSAWNEPRSLPGPPQRPSVTRLLDSSLGRHRSVNLPIAVDNGFCSCHLCQVVLPAKLARRRVGPVAWIVIMGVAGCGKSSLGAAVASQAGLAFIEGDTFHSPQALAKMRAGIPLSDADRTEWLHRPGGGLGTRAQGGGFCLSA